MTLNEMLSIVDLDEIDALATQLISEDHDLMRDLVQARKDSGLTVTQVSERMAISEDSVLALEHDRDPRLSTLRRYSLAIGALVAHEVTPAAIDPHRGVHGFVE